MCASSPPPGSNVRGKCYMFLSIKREGAHSRAARHSTANAGRPGDLGVKSESYGS
jgi:hypothetical protein